MESRIRTDDNNIYNSNINNLYVEHSCLYFSMYCLSYFLFTESQRGFTAFLKPLSFLLSQEMAAKSNIMKPFMVWRVPK
jgi:hypothetical protein